MLKRLGIAAALAGCLASPVFAKPLNLQLPAPQKQELSDVIAVETGRPAAAVIATDALYGGLAGAAIGAGVALIEGNNYGRNIAVGAGIGLIAGGIVGAVDVASRSDTVMTPTEGTNRMNDRSFGVGGKF